MFSFSRCISILVLILFSSGIFEFLYNVEENDCEMTYMYRKPQFISVGLPADVKAQFPRYGLYIYGEGQYADRLAAGIRSGAPVLFIPGNGGSYKQARSLASVAQMMAEDEHRAPLLDVFTVDFDEDLAALNGRLLRRQTAFVAHCVAKIVSQYSGDHSLVIVAHSMGGVVARALFTQPGFDPSIVRVIYALASPLNRPPVYMDGTTRRFYSDISEHWHNAHISSNASSAAGGNGSGGLGGDLSQVSVVSVAGGERDLQVRLYQTVDESSIITTSSVAVPGVWAAADHQCIVWCRQLVLVTVRSLFDLVSRSGRFITNTTVINSVLRFHFVHRPHGKRYWRHLPHAGTIIKLQRNADWHHMNRSETSFTADSVRRVTYLAVEMAPDASQLTIATAGVGGRNWLMACSLNSTSKCGEAEDFSRWGQVLPSVDRKKRRSVVLSLSSIRQAGHTHLIITLSPTNAKVAVYTDTIISNARTLTVTVPELTSIRAFLGSHTVITSTERPALIYNVSLQGLRSTWQAVRLVVTPVSDCPTQTPLMTPILRLHVPGLFATNLQTTRRSDEAASIVAKLPLNLPATSSSDLGNYSSTPYVEVHVDPRCTYSIHMYNSVLHMAGNVVRLHAACILPCVAAALIWSLTEQMTDTNSAGRLLGHTAVSHVTPVKLAAPAQLVAAAVSFLVPLFPALPYFSSWTDDTWPQLPLLPLGALLVARSLLWAWLYICHMLVLFAGYVLQHSATVGKWRDLIGQLYGTMITPVSIGDNWSALRCMRVCLQCMSAIKQPSSAVLKYATKLCASVFRRAGIAEWLSELLFSIALHYSWPLAVVCVALALSSCGTVGLMVGLVISWIKVFQMYEDKVMDEDSSSEGTSGTCTSKGTMLTLAVIWCLVTVLNVPSLIVWSQTMSESRCLVEDPSLLPAVCMCISGAILWRESSPKISRRYNTSYVWLIRAIAVITISRDLHSWHVIGGWLTAVVMVTSLSQLLGDTSHPDGIDKSEIEQKNAEELTDSEHTSAN